MYRARQTEIGPQNVCKGRKQKEPQNIFALTLAAQRNNPQTVIISVTQRD